jgi:hypothetical protein
LGKNCSLISDPVASQIPAWFGPLHVIGVTSHKRPLDDELEVPAAVTKNPELLVGAKRVKR